MTRVSIIGLGWLGEPLAKYLKSIGFQVKGSSTTEEKVERLKKEEIQSHQLKFNPHPEGKNFQHLFDTDILFVNIPPRSRTMPESFHPEQVKFIKEMAEQARIPWIIFVSSTSVYPDKGQIAQESDALSGEESSNSAILKAERILSSSSNFDLTIIRFGGLLGVDRIPGKYFSGKENVIGDSPVNYIHQEDAVRLAAWVIQKGIKNEIINGVAPQHPKRKEVYEKNALELGFTPPVSYASAGNSWKEINGNKIIDSGFEFKFPNPLDFTYRSE